MNAPGDFVFRFRPYQGRGGGGEEKNDNQTVIKTKTLWFLKSKNRIFMDWFRFYAKTKQNQTMLAPKFFDLQKVWCIYSNMAMILSFSNVLKISHPY